MTRLRRHLSYANIAATLALALALGGTGAYAGSLVTSKHIKNGTIKRVDIHAGTITPDKLDPSALTQGYANTAHSNVALKTTPTVVTVAVPGPGDYVLTAKSILTNNETLKGSQVTCTLYAETVPVDASVTALAAKATLGGPNASITTISVLGTRTFTAAGTAELRCDSGGNSVTAADGAITAIRLP